MDVNINCPGSVHDITGSGAFLCRFGAGQECPFHAEHSAAIACLVSVLWFAGAYPLAFVGGNPWIGDLSQAFLAGVARGAVHP